MKRMNEEAMRQANGGCNHRAKILVKVVESSPSFVQRLTGIKRKKTFYYACTVCGETTVTTALYS